jgi:hypothetical protein
MDLITQLVQGHGDFPAGVVHPLSKLGRLVDRNPGGHKGRDGDDNT